MDFYGKYIKGVARVHVYNDKVLHGIKEGLVHKYQKLIDDMTSLYDEMDFFRSIGEKLSADKINNDVMLLQKEARRIRSKIRSLDIELYLSIHKN